MLRSALVCALLVTPLDALADEGAAGEGRISVQEEQPRKLALSASLLRAVMVPMGELGGEMRHGSSMASAVTVGAGAVPVDTRTMSGDFRSETRLCISAGAQFRYYAFGDFDRGMFVGGETFFSYIDRDTDNSVRPPNDGIWAGPTIGYKYTFGFGMLVSAKITAGIALYRPDGLSKDEVPGDVDVMDWPVIPWPNLSVGWAL